MCNRFLSSSLRLKIILFRVSAALCSTAETKAAELGAQNPGGGISHGPELDTLGEGENLYTGWSSGTGFISNLLLIKV